jgi:16S rRNA (uracil1498-N3)-methyltransferase
MTSRYFVDEPLSIGDATLTGPEAHHLIHVMRAVPGEQVVLFDGHGAEFQAVVGKIGRGEVKLSVLSRDEVDRESSIHVTLAVALPKGDRQKWLIEKAVELGVACIVPLSTERGVAQPIESALVRLRRLVIEASKQCGRNRLMQIETPWNWSELVAGTPHEASRLLAHPRLDPSTHPWVALSDRVVAAIGPEGGFSDAEVSLALDAGWQPVDLGGRILRVETAALALATLATGVGRVSRPF